MIKLRLAGLLLVAGAPITVSAMASPAQVLQGTTALPGLLPVHVDRSQGRILLSLPAPGPDGISGRFLYVTALETGLGSAALNLDRGRFDGAKILVFRRVGRKVVAEIENHRFRASGAPAAEEIGVSGSFAYSTIWTGDIAAEEANGNILVDVANFLARDDMGIAETLGGGFRMADNLSVADPNSVKVFSDNIEMEGRLTFVSQNAGAEVSAIAPVAGNLSFVLRHSLIRLPEPGYQPRRADPRIGTMASQVVDFAQPLGAPIVYELVNRFRLERLDPGAPRSRVRRPIVIYIDTSAPEPIRTALYEGASWWCEAFEAAGYIDAFRVEYLPEGVDPLDIRYTVVRWINRASRGWSYGGPIQDPRTGETVRGQIVLESVRIRQAMIMLEGLAGAAQTGTGGPNDPARIALARIRQIAAHEVGHILGIGHNFGASTQGRYSVMDYVTPRVGLVDGVPDLSDAYGSGIGPWDRFAVDWLYGARTEAEAEARMTAALAAGLRFVGNGPSSANPDGSLGDDRADPVAELRRIMAVRAAAVRRFGPAALYQGEPVANLRRKFVPIWLIHRYQVDAAAKLIGGVYFTYSRNGDGQEAARPAAPEAQTAALDALLDTLSPTVLTVPATLLPYLSAGRPGSPDMQEANELIRTTGGNIFDPLAASETAAQVTLNSLLAPERLNRLEAQHQADPRQMAPQLAIDRLIERMFDFRGRDDAEAVVQRRVAVAAVLAIARLQRDPSLSSTIALALSERIARLGRQLAAAPGRGLHADWSRGLGRLLNDNDALAAALAEQHSIPAVPPGPPFGGGEEF